MRSPRRSNLGEFRLQRERTDETRNGISDIAGVPRAGGKIGITFTLLPPHCMQTKCRCFGTSTKIISFQSLSSSNVFTA
jgi:hypothetical protein